jgi:hypothetical protein
MRFKTIKGKHYVYLGNEVLEFKSLRTAWKFIFIACGKLETAQ